MDLTNELTKMGWMCLSLSSPSATSPQLCLYLQDYLLRRAKPNRQWLLSPALVTDIEPTEVIRMCVWAHCLDQLPQEIPYGIVVAVDECEHVRQAEGDDRVYVHARLRCPNERTIVSYLQFLIS